MCLGLHIVFGGKSNPVNGGVRWTLALILAGLMYFGLLMQSAQAANFNLSCSSPPASVNDQIGTGAITDTVSATSLPAGGTMTFTTTHQGGGNIAITISQAGGTTTSTPTSSAFTVSNSVTTNVSTFTIAGAGSRNFTIAITGSSTGGRLASWTATCAGGVADTDPPTLVTSPGNLTANTDPGVNTAVVTYTDPTFTDNVGVVSVVQIAGLPSGGSFPLGVTTNTFRATDAAGNSFDHSFTVTVSDAEDPVISGVPANIVQSTDAGVNTAV